MSTAVEIEKAIEVLPPVEYAKLLEWLDDRRAIEVDAQFETAVRSGKFDRLAERARKQIDAGETVALDDFLRSDR